MGRPERTELEQRNDDIRSGTLLNFSPLQLLLTTMSNKMIHARHSGVIGPIQIFKKIQFGPLWTSVGCTRYVHALKSFVGVVFVPKIEKKNHDLDFLFFFFMLKWLTLKGKLDFFQG